MNDLPRIIQGGMGAGVSSWRLARAVSSLGQLGVVSGVALDALLARRLQDGDPGGHLRRALEHFPFPAIAQKIIGRYFIEGGKGPKVPYATVPMHSLHPPRRLTELCVAANFVEVWLAREGHDNPVGINFLEKIQLPHLPSMYGAMLAGVSFVLMGAGIPLKVPGALAALADHQPATYEISVTGASADSPFLAELDPSTFFDGEPLPSLTVPKFLPIISSNVLATTLLRRANGPVGGFIVEAPTAGGHNAPPRGRMQLDDSGQPVYGSKDAVDLEKIRELGLPFWLAGGRATREGLEQALAAGATGVQIGTAFAFCEESGLDSKYRNALVRKSARGDIRVHTDAAASPTGFPFKVARLEHTASEPDVYQARERVCDLGFLREAYVRPDGKVGYRCPSEPVDAYVQKGGAESDTIGRKCLCNGLVANVGQPQIRQNGSIEPALITAGDDLAGIGRFLAEGRESYSARDVIDAIL